MPNWSFFGQQILIFTGKSKSLFLYPHNVKTTYASCSHCFLVRHGTKWATNTNIWPKMTKNANFGPNLAVFRPKILILTGGSKSFCTHITEKPPGQLVHISFLRGIGSNGPKKPIFGQIWPFLSQKFIFGGME